jgi:uncharacterized protein (TIGR02145 family)
MLKLHFLLILAASLFLACVAIGVYEEDAIEKCGGKKYASAMQICENDILKIPCGTGGNYYDPSTQFCYENNVVEKCGGEIFNPQKEQFCDNNIVYVHCGINVPEKAETHFCSNDELYKKCDGKDYDPTIYECENDKILFFIFIDNRDNQEYKAVVIDSQIWMAENLNFDDGGNDSLGECYNNESINCTKYGRLYNWATAMKACPSGWHLPREAEWETLIKFVDRGFRYEGEHAGKKLKATSGWNDYQGTSGNGTDDYGFAALPYPTGNIGKWWNTQEYVNEKRAGSFQMYSKSSAIEDWSCDKSEFLSVRCLKD